MVQKGGKILGRGRDGLVVTPPIMCTSKMNKVGKVSKLINLASVSKTEYKEYLKEFKIGQIFTKADPNQEHYLPGMDLCRITDSDVSEEIIVDLKKAKYKRGNQRVDMINIVMKKGDDFKKITEVLSENNFLKSLAYLLEGAKKTVYELGILLLDIKSDNLLYSRDGKGNIYPVFIDFSYDYVIDSHLRFKKFIKEFGVGMVYYSPWAPEINGRHYQVYKKKNEIRYTDRRVDMFLSYMEDFVFRGLKGKTVEMKLDEYGEYVTDQKTKAEQRLMYDKMMVYAIGMAYKEVLYRAKNKKLKTSAKISSILRKMTSIEPMLRYSISETLKELQTELQYKNKKDLLISLRGENLIKSNNKIYVTTKKVDRRLTIPKGKTTRQIGGVKKSSKMTQESYEKRYMGKENKRRTVTYKKNKGKGMKLVVKYPGLKAIYKGKDLTGYLKRGKVYATKSV